MILDGILYALAAAAAGAVVTWLAGPWYAVPLYLAAAFCLWFFRDPERAVPPGDVAVAPADGKVVAIKAEGPALTRISIFLNIFDVHVNRAPVAGRISGVFYKKGTFRPAQRDECSEINEQNTLVIDSAGGEVAFKQIAGLIARRIVCWKKPGDTVRTGERVGLIKFGSRCDVLLGPEWEIGVRTGMRVRAGSSVLARRRPQ